MKLASLALLVLMACGKANPVPPPTIWYNDLLVQAGVQGPVRFQVRLDSLGSPQLPTFEILAAPNPWFAVGIRKGLEQWRDPSMSDGRVSIGERYAYVAREPIVFAVEIAGELLLVGGIGVLLIILGRRPARAMAQDA